MTKIQNLLSVAMLVSLSPAICFATPIIVPGGDFESPVTGNGYSFTAPGWFGTGGNTGVEGFRAVGYSSAPSGIQIGWVGGPGTGSLLSAASLGNIQAGLTYTLTLDLGNPPGTTSFLQPGTYVVELLANGVAIPASVLTVNGDAITDGTFSQFSTGFTAPLSGGIVGQPLTIGIYDYQIAADNDASITDQGVIDNVRLTNSVPEPSASVLGLIGMVAMVAGCMRSRVRKALKCLLLVALVNTLGLATVGFADSITVPGFSFEDPVTHSYTYTTFGGTVGRADADSSGPAAAGWIVSEFNAGVSVPGASDFSSVADGSQLGYFGGPGNGSMFSASSLATVAPDTRYTLTVALANNGVELPGLITLELLVNGTPVPASVVTIDGNTAVPVDGAWHDFSTSFASPHSGGTVGGALTIGLLEVQEGDHTTQASIDNVRLTDVTTLPEPSSFVMGGLSVAALVGGWMRGRGHKTQRAL